MLIGADARDAQAMLPPGMPVLRTALVPELGGLDLDRPYLAFAGIGRPEKFFSGLRGAGVMLAGARAFADHHPYSPAELAALVREADAAGATLLTTPKDRARLAQAAPPGIAVAGVTLAWEDEAALNALLAEVVP